MSSWPAALRLETRKILDGVIPFPKEGILRMKNISNFLAYLKQGDLRNGQIILYDAETQLTTTFRTAGEMFDAGWIADLKKHTQYQMWTTTEEMTDSCTLPGATTKLTSSKELAEGNKVVPLKTCKAKERV